jgi:TRAP-type uncharacterized transport system substrate-binding protein
VCATRSDGGRRGRTGSRRHAGGPGSDSDRVGDSDLASLWPHHGRRGHLDQGFTTRLAFRLGLPAGRCARRPRLSYKIVTASERGTYIKIGRDLAQFVAPPADIALEVLPSAGSVENVRRLRYESGVKFALVQSDVYQSFLDLASGGNSEASAHDPAIARDHAAVQRGDLLHRPGDSPLNYVHEIKGAKINAGELGSGTALTSATLYRLMFGEAIPDASATYLSNEEALVKLVTDKTLDVVAVVAGQPAKLLVDMKPEARQRIKLLKFDANHPASKAVLKTYFQATCARQQLPEPADGGPAGLAVKAFLVTYDFQVKGTEAYLRRFARSLCQNFPTLQEKGHPKWREVELALPDLGRGWNYYAATARELRSPTATTSLGSGVASQVRRKASSMCRETGPVTSSRSAWRGLATKRIPRPSRL